ncbi:MAG: tRNA lysidine(34) synthetase TilS [Bacilli bacterium]|nr:tRNA lysidine(34) synthetase TilS [Bacilli bacterium]
MVNLQKVITEYFNNHAIDINSSTVVIGVSTGVDSMVLLDLISKYTTASIVIAHVNHGKRVESTKEEEYIKKYAKDNDIKIYVYHIQKQEIEEGNFQEKARDIRYKFFKEVMIKEDAKYLLLAHHLNDDIETMLFRLQRGSNLAGYAGISDFVKIEEGYIARPLLGVLKEDIVSYAKANNIKYFEDSSNELDIYSRNKIRHNDVVEIFDAIEDASNNFIEMKNNIKNAAIVLNEYRDNLIKAIVKKQKNGYSFKVDDFKKVHEYIAREIIFNLTKENKLSSKQVDEIMKIIYSSKANIVTEIGSIQVVKSYNEVYLFINKIEENVNIEITINDLNKLEYNVDNVIVNINNIDNDACRRSSKNCYMMSFNYNYLPLVIRNWRNGDKIVTASGTKKVSRILIDNHISMLDRKKTLVVCKDDDVLMVVGLQKSLKALEKYTKLEDCNMIINFKKEDYDA